FVHFCGPGDDAGIGGDPGAGGEQEQVSLHELARVDLHALGHAGGVRAANHRRRRGEFNEAVQIGAGAGEAPGFEVGAEQEEEGDDGGLHVLPDEERADDGDGDEEFDRERPQPRRLPRALGDGQERGERRDREGPIAQPGQQKVPFRGQAEQVGEEGGGEERPRPDHDPVTVARAHATLNTGYPSFVTASASSSGEALASSYVICTREELNNTRTACTPSLKVRAFSIFFTQEGQVNGSVVRLTVFTVVSFRVIW